jgi:hypothetical protein
VLQAVLLATLRLCIVLLSVEVSGLAHTGLDLFDALRGLATEAEDCEEDCGGECPPGCVSCHCAHGTTTPQEVFLWIEHGPARVVVSVSAEVSAAPPATQAPAGADPSSIYRPPRRSLHS